MADNRGARRNHAKRAPSATRTRRDLDAPHATATTRNGYRWEGNCLILNIRAQPRSSCDEFGEVRDGWIKLRITAPPVDGKANAHILKVLSKLFRVPVRRVELLSGVTTRDKTLRIEAPEQLPSMIRRR
ncbi:MAG: DUF167 family protein [Thiotrichales bacterium]